MLSCDAPRLLQRERRQWHLLRVSLASATGSEHLSTGQSAYGQYPTLVHQCLSMMQYDRGFALSLLP